MVVAIEKRGKGVSRMYGRVIERASKKNLKKFMGEHIGKEAQVCPDGWTGYKGLESEFLGLTGEKSGKRVKKFRNYIKVL